MLPGLRLALMTIAVTLAVIVTGLGELSRYRAAQTESASLPRPEIRLAGLAFAARADWTPEAQTGPVSLDRLAPFANVPRRIPHAEDDAAVPEPASPVELMALAAEAEPQPLVSQNSAAEPAQPAQPAANLAATAPAENPAPRAAEVRIALADTPQPVSDAEPVPLHLVAGPALAAETADAEIAAPGLLAGAHPESPSGAAAAVIAELETVAPSAVKLPTPRPPHQTAAPSKPKLAPAKKKVAARRPAAKPAHAARKPPAAPRRAASESVAQDQNPFATLFGSSNSGSGN